MANDLKLGSVIEGTAERDAIHVAVAPVVAAERLAPGQHIGFLNSETVGAVKQPIGIVDPYLSGPMFKGDRFWMFLYPNTITALRHDWTHPAFNQAAAVNRDSEQWISTFARSVGVDYAELMEHAKYFVEDETYWSEGGRFEGEWATDEFWNHYEVVTGEKFPQDKRGGIFSCPC